MWDNMLAGFITFVIAGLVFVFLAFIYNRLDNNGKLKPWRMLIFVAGAAVLFIVVWILLVAFYRS